MIIFISKKNIAFFRRQESLKKEEMEKKRIKNSQLLVRSARLHAPFRGLLIGEKLAHDLKEIIILQVDKDILSP